MKFLATFLAIATVLLTGCGSSLEGTYHRLGRDGEIRRTEAGQPQMTLVLQDGSALLQSGTSQPSVGRYQVMDGKVVLQMPDFATTFTVTGDLLQEESQAARPTIFKKQ